MEVTEARFGRGFTTVHPESGFETIEAEHAYTIVEKIDAQEDIE